MIDQLEQPSAPGYALLDVGDARRLERFGDLTLDRPAPSAEGHLARDPAAWPLADGRYDREDRGRVGHERWTTRDGAPIEPWNLREDELAFELRLAAGGQVGYFPEQAANRRWIGRQVRRIAATSGPRPAVLNLFGYTGASTVAALAAGASATHVDAARSAVAWARRNAALNGLTEAPVRWISDDAIAFAERELRRGRRYAGVILDPPSYGHGTSGHAWRLAPGLPALLATCAELLQDGPAFIVLTAHTPGFGPERLGEALLEALEPRAGAGAVAGIEVDDQSILADGGTRLHLGAMARWSR